jgi:ABC-2 type transport system permease protein/oleandomycin transport system permease protein
MSQNTISLQAAIAEAAREQTLSEKLKWFVLDTLEITKRNLIHYIRLPQLIFFSFIQPIIFVLLFTQVFGGAMGSIISLTYGTDYVNYLLPGIFVQTALFSGAATTVGLATDLQKGMIDRFRSLPMSRAAVLTGRTIADSVRSIFTITIMIVVGSLLGFRFSGTFAESALAVILCILWGYCCTWIFAWIGVLAKDPETAQTAGFIWVFPLQFASSIFVPSQTMSGFLQWFAENQPLTLVANTVRALVLGQPADQLGAVLVWMVGIVAVFGPLAVWQYTRRTK